VRVSAQDGGERVYTVVFAVVDRVPPTAEVSYSTTAPTNGDVTVTITPSEPVTVTNNDALTSRTFTENGSFTFEFIDAAGNKGTVTATVTNIDKKAPALKLSVNKPVLKADDHRLETIRVTAAATDAESGIASVILRSITSSDPDDGIGDGVTGGDIQGAEFGTADFEFQLRAERSGVKTSRVYTITYRATDLAGNWTDVSTTVTVPR
jgi:hypothetical protein